MINKTFLFSIILVCALVFSGWLIQQMSGQTIIVNTKTNTPDAFMQNATYIKLDLDGKLHNKIYVTKMEHYAAHDSSQFTAPRVIFYDQDHIPWNITADYGESQGGVSQVRLWGNVKIHKPGDGKNHELTMTTTSLVIFPEKQLAQTDQPVTILEPGTVINAVGLRANLNTGEIQLLSQAKGVYEATPN